MAAALTGPPALRVRGLGKTFGRNRVLSGLSFEVRAGAVTALLGENGSGKSTLVKILAGVHAPDPGDARVEAAGTPVALPLTPDRAHAAGLRFLHQDLGLVPELTVADNLALADRSGRSGLAPTRRRDERRRAAELLAPFDVAADPGAHVADLPVSERSMVAVARTFGDVPPGRPPVVFLDEPTAALAADDVARLFAAIRRLCARGAAVVLISHRLEEVLEIADHVLVLRDGRLVADRPAAGLTTATLVEDMTGRRVEPGRAAPAGGGDAAGGVPALSVRGLRGTRLRGVDLDLRAGEVLGLTGLVGCGRSELARIVGGAQRPRGGSVEVGGTAVRLRSPADAIARGIVGVPQDRHAHGVLLDLSVRENLTLGDLRPVTRRGAIGRAAERAEARALIEEFDIRPPDPEAALRTLSGGNQQKVALARAVRLEPRVLVLDEPSQGIDIGAREGIGRVVRRLRDAGVAVLLATSDLDELMDLADRVVVLDRGRVHATLRPADAGRDDLFHAVTLSGRAA
ncbi:sugar ABC transporter ATP-binding protein [Actinomadura atramentaria]|uniref:sugar ABC transporter ATP-binding protein n=1 Tax=Actinomadura atramentaria TaxID=1990 RepID=UPI00036BD919|nr:sugar ABC transporter ATP-binding protein [Actinomadura atramentaria]